MNVVILIHQEGGLGHSMRRYNKSLIDGLCKNNHTVYILEPRLHLSKPRAGGGLNKWLKYIDMYLFFPLKIRKEMRKQPEDTLYVLLDQALALWMPLIKNKKHIVHCHDFIALKSSLGQIAENKISLSGKIYQTLIKSGFNQAKNFVSVSKNTQEELALFLKNEPEISECIYNSIEDTFAPGDAIDARLEIEKLTKLDLSEGYILHVGSHNFYKNRKGVLAIYQKWRERTKKSLPLLMIGSPQNPDLGYVIKNYPYVDEVDFLTNVNDNMLIKAYQGASAFLFPSHYEGFGYPLAEAICCGCPVVTTDKAPMNELGGDFAFYIDKLNSENEKFWAKESALVLEQAIQLKKEERKKIFDLSLSHKKQFSRTVFDKKIEDCYHRIFAT